MPVPKVCKSRIKFGVPDSYLEAGKVARNPQQLYTANRWGNLNS